MNCRKVSKRRNLGRLGMTSTPLNEEKGTVPLLSPKNISVVKKTYKGIGTSIFETPSTTKIGIWGKNNRSSSQYSRIFTHSDKSKDKRRCDTPLKSRRSSLLSNELTACTHKLKFSQLSDIFRASKMSDCKKQCGSIARESTVAIGEKDVGKWNETKCSVAFKTLRKEVTTLLVRQQTVSSVELSQEDSSKCSSNSFRISQKENLSEKESVSEIASHSSSSSNKSNSSVTDNSDSIETCRKISTSSTMSSTVDYSLNIDVLGDEYSGTEESSVIDTDDSECVTDQQIFSSDSADGNSMQNSENIGSKSQLLDLLEEECEALSKLKIDEDIGIVSEKHIDSDKLDIHMDVSVSEGRILETEINDQRQSSLPDALNKAEVAVVSEELNNAEVDSTELNDCNARESHISNSKTLEEKIPKNSPDKDYFHAHISSKNNENTIGDIASDKTDVFKKPFPLFACDMEESDVRKITLKNKSGIRKRAQKDKSGIRSKTLKDKLLKISKIPTLKDISSYPSTSTPFDSPDCSNKNFPSVFNNVSPVNIPSKNSRTLNCPLDDILITGIKTSKIYGKRAKKQLNSAKKNKSQKWECFLKTHSNDNHKKKNKNNYINESSDLENKTNYFLFETPPLSLNQGIPVDDIWRLRNESPIISARVKSNKEIKGDKSNTKSSERRVTRSGKCF